MSLLLSEFKATASPHVAGLICFLSLIFFFDRADPLWLLSAASYSIFGAGNKSILFGAAGGQGRATSKGMQSGSAVPVIVLPCVWPPLS